MQINFITGNPQKVAIANAALNPEFTIKATNIDLPEHQSMCLKTIASNSAEAALAVVGEPLILTDSGFFIEALNGFPGPFVKWTNQTLSTENFMAMLKGKQNRRAYTEDCLVLGVPGQPLQTFYCRVPGQVSLEPGRGMSTISKLFLPDELGHIVAKLPEQQEAEFWAKHNTNYAQLKAYLQKTFLNS